MSRRAGIEPNQTRLKCSLTAVALMLSRYLAAARTVRPVAVVPGPRYYAIRPKPVTHPENEEIVRGLEKCEQSRAT